MQLGTSSDAELVRLAQRGASPPFAVLLHRHGPAVRARVAADRDPTGAVVATFVAAMRRLPKRSPDEPLRPWLLGLADRQVHRPTPLPEHDDELPPLDPDEADEIWAELELRWPRGRVRRSLPRWVGGLALLVVMVALAVLVPYLLLTVGTDDADDGHIEDVVARPYEEQPEREPAEELFDGATTGDGVGAPTDDTTTDEPDIDGRTDATTTDEPGVDGQTDATTTDEPGVDGATGDDPTGDAGADDLGEETP